MPLEYFGAVVCVVFTGLGVLIGYVIWGTEVFHNGLPDSSDGEEETN